MNSPDSAPFSQLDPVAEATPPPPRRGAATEGSGTFLRSGLPMLAAYLLMMALIITCAWLLITQDWVRQQRIQEVELSSLARAQEEHVSHTFGKAVESLHIIADLIAFNNTSPSMLSRRLSEEAAETMAATPQLCQFAAFANDGSTLLDVQRHHTNRLPAPATAYWQQNHDAQLFIHPPVQNEQHHWFIPIERAIRNPRGEMLGHAFAVVSTQDFNEFFRETQLTPQDRFSLLSLNGHMLLHFPLAQGETPPDFSDIVARSLGTNNSPTFHHTYQFGNAVHTGVFRLVRGLPLIAVVSRPTDVAQAGFFAMRQRLVAGVAALAVLLAVMCWLIYSDTRRHEAARTVLRRMNTSLEERVSRRTAELEQSNRELIAFSYSISHDLRAPLRAINGFAYALKEDFGERLDAQGRDYLDRVYRASVRMGELIDELLALANVSRTPLTIRDVDLTVMANDIVADLRINSPGREVQFTAQPGMHTEGDEALLRNALQNLLHNAWKFTRARPVAIISLSAEDDGDAVRFTLADNGIGFDMAHAKRLFQPFQQLHGDLGFGGTGIGLASVLRVIERHGGQIWAEATPDEGARFIFVLPRRAKVIRRRREA